MHWGSVENIIPTRADRLKCLTGADQGVTEWPGLSFFSYEWSLLIYFWFNIRADPAVASHAKKRKLFLYARVYGPGSVVRRVLQIVKVWNRKNFNRYRMLYSNQSAHGTRGLVCFPKLAYFIGNVENFLRFGKFLIAVLIFFYNCALHAWESGFMIFSRFIFLVT